VTYIGRKVDFGNIMSLDHGYGYLTRYGHNSKILVRAGQQVRRGQVIAFVGSTGKSTGPHLHYEVLRTASPSTPRTTSSISPGRSGGPDRPRLRCG